MDFNNVNEASGGDMIKPGHKGVFTISKVEDTANSNGKQYLAVTFDSPDGGLRHSFYTSQAALPRIKHLWSKATQSELEGNVTEQQIITGLTGKSVGLKITGRIGNNGKTYPDLSFGGFACLPADIDSLEFTKKEQDDIEKALANLEAQASSAADAEPATDTSAADNF